MNQCEHGFTENHPLPPTTQPLVLRQLNSRVPPRTSICKHYLLSHQPLRLCVSLAESAEDATSSHTTSPQNRSLVVSGFWSCHFQGRLCWWVSPTHPQTHQPLFELFYPPQFDPQYCFQNQNIMGKKNMLLES